MGTRIGIVSWMVWASLVAHSLPIRAATDQRIGEDLSKMSLQEPLDITVVTAARPGQENGDSPRSISVITAEDNFVEPITLDETMPNPPGDLDLRWSTEYSKRDAEQTLITPRFQLFYGITSNLGAEVGIGGLYRKEDSSHYGLGDISFSLKRILLRHGPVWPALVLGLEVERPGAETENNATRTKAEIKPFIAVLKNWSHFTVQGNVGWSRNVGSNEGERRNEFTSGVAVAIPVGNGKVHLVAELNRMTESRFSAAPGFKLHFGRSRFFAIAAPLGLNGDTAKWGLVTQFQLGF